MVAQQNITGKLKAAMFLFRPVSLLLWFIFFIILLNHNSIAVADFNYQFSFIQTFARLELFLGPKNYVHM